jgi:hypothetical protein
MPETARERIDRFKQTTGALGYTTIRGPTGAHVHPDRCVCQGHDTTPHQHYRDAPHRCARCLDCIGYRPAFNLDALEGWFGGA